MGSTIPASSNGGITDATGWIGTIPDKPVGTMAGSGTLSTIALGQQPAGTYGFNWKLETDGRVIITSLTNADLAIIANSEFACDFTIDL